MALTTLPCTNKNGKVHPLLFVYILRHFGFTCIISNCRCATHNVNADEEQARVVSGFKKIGRLLQLEEGADVLVESVADVLLLLHTAVPTVFLNAEVCGAIDDYASTLDLKGKLQPLDTAATLLQIYMLHLIMKYEAPVFFVCHTLWTNADATTKQKHRLSDLGNEIHAQRRLDRRPNVEQHMVVCSWDEKSDSYTLYDEGCTEADFDAGAANDDIDRKKEPFILWTRQQLAIQLISYAKSLSPSVTFINIRHLYSQNYSN